MDKNWPRKKKRNGIIRQCGRKKTEWKKSSGKTKIKEIFGSSFKYIKYIHDTKVFGVMSYNYMFLALYSLKSFFFILRSLYDSFSAFTSFSFCRTVCISFFLEFVVAIYSNYFPKRRIHVLRFFGFDTLSFFPLLIRFCVCVCFFSCHFLQLLRPQTNSFLGFGYRVVIIKIQVYFSVNFGLIA